MGRSQSRRATTRSHLPVPCSASCRVVYDDSLRAASVEGLRTIGFDGYALGGLAVGESAEERISRCSSATTALLPIGGGRDT